MLELKVSRYTILLLTGWQKWQSDSDQNLIPVLSDSTDAEKTGNYHPVPAGIEDAERILRQIQADTGFRIPGAGAE